MIKMTMRTSSGGDPVAALTERARTLRLLAEKLPEAAMGATISAMSSGGEGQQDFTAGSGGTRSANSMPWYKRECIDAAIAQQGLDEKWEDNAAYTKKKKGAGKPVLVDSGEMRDSFVLDFRAKGDGVEVWLSNTSRSAEDGANKWAVNWDGLFINPRIDEGFGGVPPRQLGYIGATAFYELAKNIAENLKMRLHHGIVWSGTSQTGQIY